MKLSLIGMSGSGKSYWSNKLAEKGFARFSCDDFIEKHLNSILREARFSGIQDVAKWMGQPYDPQYKTASETYLKIEKQAMDYVFEMLAKNEKNIVIDTTGSVIYMEKHLLKRLEELTRIVYLETPQSVQDEMYQLYLQDPKPVIWGESFRMKDGETPKNALKRCYPQLLAFRTRHYETLADVTIDYHKARKDLPVDKFLQVVTI